MLRRVSRFARLPVIAAVLADFADLTGFAFIEAVLVFLDIRYIVDQVERERIPQSGRVLIVADHPSGAIGAIALLHLVGSVRRDSKIVANDFFRAVDGIRDLLPPLRPLSEAGWISAAPATMILTARRGAAPTSGINSVIA